MEVLIVEDKVELGQLWARDLESQGAVVYLATSEDAAMDVLRDEDVDMIVADLDLSGSGAIAIADYAAYRRPDARVVFVTATSFFSDGQVFTMCPNACAFLPAQTSPADLAAVVAHHGARRHKA